LPKLFGSSGIRGLFESEVTPLLALKLGAALPQLPRGVKHLVLGWDSRTSGHSLALAVAAGASAYGCDVTLAGLTPTPVLAYLTRFFDMGVMVTASHNPPEYNGLKVFIRDGSSLPEEECTFVEEFLLKGSPQAPSKPGSLESAEDLVIHYIDEVLRAVSLKRCWRVAIDPGCGSSGYIALKIFQSLGCQVYALNTQPDGFFPARRSEPDEESLSTLSRYVALKGLDLGFAYDGDADRVVAVDSKGRVVQQDSLLASYAHYAAAKAGSGTVVVNVDTSACVDVAVEDAGGRVFRTKVGDVFIAEELKSAGGVMGSEPCGAWIHPWFSLAPDGIFSSVLILKALEELNLKLEEFTSKYKPFTVLRGKLPCPNHLKRAALEKVEELASNAFKDVTNVSKVDGLRLEFSDKSWVLIRPSGTEPIMRVTVEGITSNRANNLFSQARNIVERAIKEVSK